MHLKLATDAQDTSSSYASYLLFINGKNIVQKIVKHTKIP